MYFRTIYVFQKNHKIQILPLNFQLIFKREAIKLPAKNAHNKIFTIIIHVCVIFRNHQLLDFFVILSSLISSNRMGNP